MDDILCATKARDINRKHANGKIAYGHDSMILAFDFPNRFVWKEKNVDMVNSRIFLEHKSQIPW